MLIFGYGAAPSATEALRPFASPSRCFAMRDPHSTLSTTLGQYGRTDEQRVVRYRRLKITGYSTSA